jgi:hypothetical protein
VSNRSRHAEQPGIFSVHENFLGTNMVTASEKNNVLLVGAYERENFGDLLFLLQTESYLKDFAPRATAPFSGDMERLLGKNVDNYAGAVREFPNNSVWVVGGEVGGTSLSAAYRMSAEEAAYASFLQLGRREQRSELEKLTKLRFSASPYMPRMSAFPETHTSTLVINSVGLSGMRNMIGDRRDEAWGAVREASYVSVRDNDSSDMLRRKSIDHVLAPDLVHTLVLDSAFQSKAQSDLALIQIKAPELAKYGIEKFAKLLATSKALQSFHLRLFTAGSARGHDDTAMYHEVVRLVRLFNPSRAIDVSEAEMPLDKAREIANCGLWIGTSLHGLIISSSFDVPRIGLVLDKLVRYASTWQETMPVGVQLDDLEAAIESALADQETSRSSGRSAELAHLADTSARNAVSVLKLRTDATGRRLERQRAAQRMSRRCAMPWRKAHSFLESIS